jgi:phospholipase C
VSSCYASFCSWCAIVCTGAARPTTLRSGGPSSQQTQEAKMGEGPAIAGAGRRPTSRVRHYAAIAAATVTGAGLAVGATVASASAAPAAASAVTAPATSPASSWYFAPRTATPIKHLVVIFQENVSFDHYFGTYPNAANTDGNPFHAKPGTPAVNGLTPALLTNNPNIVNGVPYNPVRLTPAEALTCDQDHAYTPEQEAFDGGKMDKFVQFTEGTGCSLAGEVMDYYDGNTVTALWNYAQNYAMSDKNFDTDFGPSTPGALNVISGFDGGAKAVNPSNGVTEPDPGSVSSPLNSAGLGTIYGDLDPYYDRCSDSNHTTSNPEGVATGQNIGDLLDAKHITWGWFQGGFAPTSTNSGGAVCGASHTNLGGATVADYSAHHEPFQYFASTANPEHLPPRSVHAIGRQDQANHQYDLSDFYAALKVGNLPAVSYLKAAEYQDGHAGYSDPIDEQHFLVNTINQIEESPFWPSTAIVVTYDDSDGWYDHQASKVVNGSDTAQDTALCATAAITLGSYPDRCGYGPRLPLLVISPWTRDNYVSHNLTDQSSIVTFIEDNWLHGKRIGDGSYDAIAGRLDAPGGVLDFHTVPHLFPVILNPNTGEVTDLRTNPRSENWLLKKMGS